MRTVRRLGVSGCGVAPRRAGDAAPAAVVVAETRALARDGAGEAVRDRTAPAGPVSGGAIDSPLGMRGLELPDLRLVGVVLPS